MENKTIRQLSDIIKKDWQKPYFGAVPYLSAMGALNSINDNFLGDTGKEVVLYFLSNANTWRGETARAVKAELNRRVK